MRCDAPPSHHDLVVGRVEEGDRLVPLVHRRWLAQVVLDLGEPLAHAGPELPGWRRGRR